MIFTDTLVPNRIANVAIADRNKYFLKYKPPNMGKSSVWDPKFQMEGPNYDQ